MVMAIIFGLFRSYSFNLFLEADFAAMVSIFRLFHRLCPSQFKHWLRERPESLQHSPRCISMYFLDPKDCPTRESGSLL